MNSNLSSSGRREAELGKWGCGLQDAPAAPWLGASPHLASAGNTGAQVSPRLTVIWTQTPEVPMSVKVLTMLTSLSFHEDHGARPSVWAVQSLLLIRAF